MAENHTVLENAAPGAPQGALPEPRTPERAASAGAGGKDQSREEAAAEAGGELHWAAVSALPTSVTAAVTILGFRVRDVLALAPGAILSSAWTGGRDVPVLAGDRQFAWAEFEVTDGELNARITRFLGD